LELYKEYAKKLIDEELAGKEENASENVISSKDEETFPNLSNKSSNMEPEENKKENSTQLRSSIRKKEQVPISTQKVSFNVGDTEGTKDNENEKNIEIEGRPTLHTNNLTPHMENKIRNSIKLLENDIKTLEITQVLEKKLNGFTEFTLFF
jgi:hypothetical protein